MVNKDPGRTEWFLFSLLALIWGSSFILMKEGMKSLTAVQVASLRIVSAGFAFLPMAPKVFSSVSGRSLPLIILTGLLGTFFPAYLFCMAETRLDSGLVGILNVLTPLFTLLIGVTFFRQRIILLKWMGVILGFVGVLLLFWTGNKKINLNSSGHAGFVILATLMYGVNVNLVSHYLRKYTALQISTIALTILLLPAFLILISTGYFSNMGNGSSWYLSTLASIFLGFMGTAVATLLYYALLKKAGGLFSSMVTYVIPFVAMFWGYLAGEEMGLKQLACFSVILAGVLLAQRK